MESSLETQSSNCDLLVTGNLYQLNCIPLRCYHDQVFDVASSQAHSTHFL